MPSYTFIGYNSIYGYKHLKTHSQCDRLCGSFIRDARNAPELNSTVTWKMISIISLLCKLNSLSSTIPNYLTFGVFNYYYNLSVRHSSLSTFVISKTHIVRYKNLAEDSCANAKVCSSESVILLFFLLCSDHSLELELRGTFSLSLAA